MAIDTDQIDEVLQALEAADSVDAGDIRVVSENDTVVLRGTVATFEESTAAQQVAGEHADAVRNELTVDPNLRESGGSEQAGSAPADRREELRGSSYDPVEGEDDLVADSQDALDENVSWDPPHESVEVPTRAESRGVADRRTAPADADVDTQLDDDPHSDAKSLPDVSPEELARTAQPQATEEDTN